MPLNLALGEKAHNPMEQVDLLERLKALFLKNEGVSVVEAVRSDDYFRIELTASNPTSRLLIIEAAHAANVHFNVWARYPVGSPEAIQNPEKAIQYRCSANKVNEAEDNLCRLGAHLTWMMYRIGIISGEEEKNYCEVFGAISKSA